MPKTIFIEHPLQNFAYVKFNVLKMISLILFVCFVQPKINAIIYFENFVKKTEGLHKGGATRILKLLVHLVAVCCVLCEGGCVQ